MDPQQPEPSSTHSLPPSLSDSGLGDMFDGNTFTNWLSEEVDWNSMNDFYYCSSDIDSGWLHSVGAGAAPVPPVQHGEAYAVQEAAYKPSNTAAHALPAETELFLPHRNLNNVSQWLDGAYRPPVPCSYCRRHRLQCLILRTTEANPNPVHSCSSCAALFRECSLARGEKRLASRFETLSPVLGHLHGVPEQMDNENNPPISSAINIGSVEERKDSKRFVRKGARILREWFHHNQEYPYPTDDQKAHLSAETGFSQKRLSTWLANARRRQKQKLQSATQASATQARAGSPIVTSTLSSMTPMERWQASPPDDDPVPESAIQDAIASTTTDYSSDLDPFFFDGANVYLFNFDESSSRLPSSASSFGSRASETSESASSAWSYHSSGDGGLPFPLLPQRTPARRRQGRHRRTEGESRYQCTFCTQSFGRRHEWSRHEKSIHLPLDFWICTPDINAIQQPVETPASECQFCDIVFPNAAHWEEHEFHVCAEKPTADRSFSRKDHLWQHLRKFHGCTKLPVADLNAWRGSGVNFYSRCGFCECALPTWSARGDHLAQHFKEGARMGQWEGDWGLDPSAMNMLRNAVLPSQRAWTPSSTQ